jgi:Rieske Fe-S protein
MLRDAAHHGEPSTDPPAGRRSFLFWVAAGLGGVAATLAALPIVGYLLGPLLKKREDDWVDLGPLKDYEPAATEPSRTTPHTFANPLALKWDGQSARTTVFVRCARTEGQPLTIQVFAQNCAHLGCPVSWFPQSGLFMCPCHGGVYYEDGRRASGPPPRGLFECVWKVEGDVLKVQAPHLPTEHDTLDRPA